MSDALLSQPVVTSSCVTRKEIILHKGVINSHIRISTRVLYISYSKFKNQRYPFSTSESADCNGALLIYCTYLHLAKYSARTLKQQCSRHSGRCIVSRLVWISSGVSALRELSAREHFMNTLLRTHWVCRRIAAIHSVTASCTCLSFAHHQHHGDMGPVTRPSTAVKYLQ